jgi:short-subunit dehydrogenase
MSASSDASGPKTALITGASAGIGAAFAEVFAAGGFDLVLVARRRERLEELAREIERRHGRRCLILAEDLSEPAAPGRIFEAVAGAGLEVDALVNNAGYALKPRFLQSDWKTQADMLQVMITSLVELCHRFAPGMCQRGRGWILNVASIAAFSPSLPGSLYNATKAFVLEFSQALASEVRPRGVHCLALCPGLTRSEFHAVMDVQRSVDRIPEIGWMSSEQVARQGYQALMAGKSLHVPGRLNQAVAAFFKHLPQRIKNRMGSRPGLID